MTNKRKPAPKAKPKTKKGPMKKNMGGKVMAYKAGGMPEKRKAMARGAAVGATEVVPKGKVKPKAKPKAKKGPFETGGYLEGFKTKRRKGALDMI